jgi:AcrR family transcriptional regulator
VPREPAYKRLSVNERRRELVDAGAALFAQHAYEEITMRQVAKAAGVSKPLLYHYFPSKIALFKAAVGEKADELTRLIEPSDSTDTALEQLTATLDAYLAWIDANAQTWANLMQSATTVPEARELIDDFRQHTIDLVITALTGQHSAPPALRIAVKGWLGYMDAAILDWTEAKDLTRDQLRDLLLAVFAASLFAAQQADPTIELDISA